MRLRKSKTHFFIPEIYKNLVFKTQLTKFNLFYSKVKIMTTRAELADILFPDVHESIEDLINKYPKRSNEKVLRFAPSPTGYLHF